MRFIPLLFTSLTLLIPVSNAYANEIKCQKKELGDMTWQEKCVYQQHNLQKTYEVVKLKNKDFNSNILPKVLPESSKTYTAQDEDAEVTVVFSRKNKLNALFQFEIAPEMATIDWRFNETKNGTTFTKTVSPP